MLNKIKSNWKLIGGIVFILIMLGAGVAMASPKSNTQTVQTTQTTIVQRGNLIATVNGSGTIAAESTIDLSFQASGTVKKIFVAEGDTVQAGQILAQLDDRTLQADLASAQAKLDSAKAKLSKTKQGASAEQITSAQAAVASAQAAYDKALKQADSANLDLESAKLSLDKARVTLDTAQAAYDRIGGASNPNSGMTQQSKDLQNASLDYQNAITKYQSQLKTLDANNQATIASAKSNLEKAKYDLANLKVRDEDITIDQASVEQAEQSLKQAQINLENATLKAPFNGIVTSVNVVIGTRTANAPVAIKMMNVTPLHVNLKLSENDVVKVQNNQEVKLTTDSIKGLQIGGTVSYIAPSGENTNGVVTYVTRVNFTATDARIKAGMTANLEIITAQKNNVLLVPNTALLPKGNAHIVQVVDIDGKTRDVQVETGLSDGVSTEIINGVSEGARIVALPSSGIVKPASMPNPFGGG